MDIFSDFCNICYNVDDGNLKDISEENLKHLKDILIKFVGHADIVMHNKMYLCQSCCEELIHFEKFKEMCFTHLIQLRQTYFNMLTELEVMMCASDDSAAVKNKFKRFVHEHVLRRNCLEKSNCSVLISTEHNEIVKSSEGLNTNKSVFNKQVIKLQPQRNRSEFDGDCSDVSVINIVTACDETISSEEIMSEKFESESKEDFDVSDVNNANVRDTSKIEFTQEEFDLNNAMMPRCPEYFTLKILGNELGNHANPDLKVPVFHSGSGSTEQELYVKQENSALAMELETSEEEFGGGLNVAFEIANVRTIVNIEDRGNENIRSEKARDGMKLRSGWCYNESIASISLTVHEHEKPYECTVCNKAFRHSGNLTVHKRIHSGDRPFKCTVCNKAFRHSGTLTVHKRIHSGDRPYKCTVCNKAFAASTGLIQHKRIHSGNMPQE